MSIEMITELSKINIKSYDFITLYVPERGFDQLQYGHLYRY